MVVVVFVIYHSVIYTVLEPLYKACFNLVPRASSLSTFNSERKERKKALALQTEILLKLREPTGKIKLAHWMRFLLVYKHQKKVRRVW